jgi:DNA-binding NarL/FixJ family response regulator
VVACLARGYSTKEVGFALGIADATVRVLLARAASKLGVRSREALLAHPAVGPLRPTAVKEGET